MPLWLAAALALAAVACAAPSRQLTSRVVEDPIVLPRKMAQLTVVGGIRHRQPEGGISRWGNGSFRLGITDRLEWTDLLQVRYALLDDRPADGRAPQPLSLALRAGFYGIGYSSTFGMVAHPTAAVETLKRLGNQWAFGLSLSWLATWSQREDPALQDPDDLRYRAGLRRSYWSLEGFATRQLTERFALTFAPGFRHTGACLSAACDWVMQSTGALLHLQFRPRHWITFRAGPYAGWRHRPSAILPAAEPLAPIVSPPPSSATWIGLSARMAVNW